MTPTVNSTSYQAGIEIGEQIVRTLPTMSVDWIQFDNVVEVSEEDAIEHEKQECIVLEENVARFASRNSKREGNGPSAAFVTHVDFRYALANKYLPNPYRHTFPDVLECADQTEFLRGIGDALWDCDGSHYGCKPEEIKVVDGGRVVELKLTKD